MMSFKKNNRSVLNLTLMAFLGLFQWNCSGGATSTEVEGLEIAQQMSLVTAQDSESSPNLASFDGDISEPTSGAYVTDETQVYTYGKSMEVMDTVNSILCYLDQTRYSEMVNQGPISPWLMKQLVIKVVIREVRAPTNLQVKPKALKSGLLFPHVKTIQALKLFTFGWKKMVTKVQMKPVKFVEK